MLAISLRGARSLGPLSAFAFAGFLACSSSGSDGPDFTPVGGGGDGGTLDGTGGGGDGPVNGETSTTTGAIQGQLLERATRAPMPGRAIKLRDAKGTLVDVTSDANGAFSANGTTPYDLWIAPGGGAVGNAGQVYLGLKATKIRVFAGDAAVPTTPTHSGTMNVTWVSPNCSGGTCKVALVARMPDGSEKYFPHPGYTAGQPIPKPFVVGMTWTGPTPSTASLGLLLTGSDGATHFFTSQTQSLADGQVVDVTLSPQSVPTLGPGSLTASNGAAAPFSPPSGKVHIALPAPGGEIEFANGSASPPLAFSVPNIPGASLSFYVNQLSGAGGFNAISATQVGTAFAAQAFSIAEGDPFPVVAPAENGTVSIASGSIDFRASTEPRSRFVQLIRSDGPSTYVWLGDPKLALSRLAGLAPAMTKAVIELAVEEHARALDDMVADMTAIATDRTSASSYAATLAP